MKIRFWFIIAGTIAGFIIIFYGLVQLQILHADSYTLRLREQLLRRGMTSERGSIFLTAKDERGLPAAINTSRYSIFAVPIELEDVGEASEQIAGLLSLDAALLRERFSKPNDQYEELIPKATDEQVHAVEQAQIKGLYVATERGRRYPFGSLAAQTLGFVAQKDDQRIGVGQYGIEKQFNELLAGTPESMDEDGRIVGGERGRDVQLTIDRVIQGRAEEVLSGLVEKYGAVGGSVIIMDPATGKIRALASVPSFDPNEYGKSPLVNFLNPAVQGLYEPGSVFKVITMAAGLDSGVITPETRYVDKGFFTADGKTIKNWDLKAHGEITMTNVIEQSVNTGTVLAEKQIGHKRFYEYLIKFGFKELTGIELPGEIAGRLTPLEKYPRDINFATASYGQGVAVTPIRLITAIATIANGGVTIEPTIIEETSPRVKSESVISKAAAQQVADMMVSAVRKAKVADIAGYRIAGKTGTAFKPDFERGGYTDKVYNTYAGFAPACGVHSAPTCASRFAILIKLDEPKDAPLAGTTVVPAFRELAEFLLNYYTTPPEQ